MYLLDTNIWLERLLDQERTEEVGQVLTQLPSDEIAITDFSFHSIGVIFFDGDFERTDRGRTTPAELIATIEPAD